MTWFGKREFQTDGAALGNDLWPCESVGTEGRQNRSIRRGTELASWLVHSRFSQVVRNSRAETVIAERGEFVMYP